MFNFCSISSSSSGNCLLVETNNTKILVDVGISAKRINTELNKINLSLDNIDAILITHEHTDHTKALNTLYKKYSIPIYANLPTLNVLINTYNIPKDVLNIIEIGKAFKINDLTITSFEIPHDAILPCGYTFVKGKNKMSIATDIGTINNSILNNIENSKFAFIESNYELSMLNVSSYPYSLKRRIASNIGHLSNTQCSNLITSLAEKNTKLFMLGHMSKENNHPDVALQTIKAQLIENNIDISTIDLSIANRDCLSTIISLEE